MNIALQKFKALTEREQRLVIVSIIVVIIGTFYWGLWSPLNNAVKQQELQLTSQQKLLIWVQEQAQLAQQLRGTATVPTVYKGTLQQAVSSSIQGYNIEISRMQPQGENLQVWIDEAPFNDFIGWLDSLEHMGLVISQADIAETDEQGYIKVRRLLIGKP
jgi:general secretion pathway protein M